MSSLSYSHLNCMTSYRFWPNNIKRRASALPKVLTTSYRYRTSRDRLIKNRENQFIDFRLITTKKGKPRFFLLCLQSEESKCSPVISPVFSFTEWYHRFCYQHRCSYHHRFPLFCSCPGSARPYTSCFCAPHPGSFPRDSWMSHSDAASCHLN